MTYRILCLLLGSATTSAWWAWAIFPPLRSLRDSGFIVIVSVLTLVSAIIVFLETDKTIKNP